MILALGSGNKLIRIFLKNQTIITVFEKHMNNIWINAYSLTKSNLLSDLYRKFIERFNPPILSNYRTLDEVAQKIYFYTKRFEIIDMILGNKLSNFIIYIYNNNELMFKKYCGFLFSNNESNIKNEDKNLISNIFHVNRFYRKFDYSEIINLYLLINLYFLANEDKNENGWYRKIYRLNSTIVKVVRPKVIEVNKVLNKFKPVLSKILSTKNKIHLI